jgi:hypothetical protein
VGFPDASAFSACSAVKLEDIVISQRGINIIVLEFEDSGNYPLLYSGKETFKP